uniref:Uncharacterized protein n=1 Tax=viral metagenome TaxID=1070528 RepID=A0A6H1ZI96_9ZZZZ
MPKSEFTNEAVLKEDETGEVGSFIPSDKENKTKADEITELLREKQRLEAKLHSMEKGADVNSRGLLAAVSGMEVPVTLNYEPEPHPHDDTGTVKYQPKIEILMKEGDLLNYFPARNGVEARPITIKQMQLMAEIEFYKNRGIVYWDGSLLPEDGGETREEAKKRGMQNFLNYVAMMEYNLLMTKTEIRINKGESSVPSDEVLKVMEPTTIKMRDLANKIKKQLDNM